MNILHTSLRSGEIRKHIEEKVMLYRNPPLSKTATRLTAAWSFLGQFEKLISSKPNFNNSFQFKKSQLVILTPIISAFGIIRPFRLVPPKIYRIQRENPSFIWLVKPPHNSTLPLPYVQPIKQFPQWHNCLEVQSTRQNHFSDIWQDNRCSCSTDPDSGPCRGTRQKLPLPWERKVREKGCFGWSSTRPAMVQWANHVTKRLTGNPGCLDSPAPTKQEGDTVWEGLEVDGWALLLLARSRWFCFAIGSLHETPLLRARVCCNVQFSLFLFAYFFLSKKC